MFRGEKTIHCLQEIYLKCKDTDRLKKLKRWKKTYHSNTNERKAGLTILLSDKAEFRSRKITRDKEKYYIITKGSILQDVLPSLMCMHQKTVSTYMRETPMRQILQHTCLSN